jgi:formylglycine-generating enzyme required for sulfatase activity
VRHAAFPDGVTRDDLIGWFRHGRAVSRRIFSIPIDDAYYDRPIALRNPIVFYEGHLPAFNINTLMKLALKCRGVDERYEILFARGIDPDSVDAVKSPTEVWPSRAEVQAYAARADGIIEDGLRHGRFHDDGQAAFTILEHEQMHQETLLYIVHEMPYARKVDSWQLAVGSSVNRQPSTANVRIPAGIATLGAAGIFGWDNEFPQHRVEVPAFTIDRHSVTNGDYLEYVNATGAAPPHFWLRRDGAWFWRAMFESLPLPLDWPVWVTHDEAAAYARWRGKRLPSEAEYHRAAFGTPSGQERLHPWGDEPPDATRGNFAFANWDPVPAGSYPAGASAWGVHDLVGNGWEWTSTIFAGFDGFEPMASYPLYSADFFDGQHYVLKGASPATCVEVIRRSFRNWFRPNYPYLYAKFRCAS